MFCSWKERTRGSHKNKTKPDVVTERFPIFMKHEISVIIYMRYHMQAEVWATESTQLTEIYRQTHHIVSVLIMKKNLEEKEKYI